MTSVVTLVGGREKGALSEASQRVAKTLSSLGLEVGEQTVLAPDHAIDIAVAGIAADSLRKSVEEALGDLPIDVAVQHAEGRRRNLLLADMDQTIITFETLDEIADEAGVKPKIAAITERAMNGELDFVAALKERLSVLKGLEEAALDRVRDRLELSPGARQLVMTMRHHGATTVLVSGGFTRYTKLVREMAGFHEDRANVLIIEDGRLAGSVAEPVLDRDAKVQTLIEFCQRIGVGPDKALCIGDGANDLGMIEAAGLGIAYRAKPRVAAAARFKITHGDLSTALYYQGYRHFDMRA